METGENCICPHKGCARHGKCAECHAHHTKDMPYCEKAKLKAKRRETRKLERGR